MCCTEIQKAFNAKKECFSEKVTSVKGEHGRQFLIELPKNSIETFCLIKVDKCLIVSTEEEKCDFVFGRCSNADFYFVECKGKKVKKGFDQIVATIGHFQKKMNLEKDKIWGFIVASEVKSPNRNARIQNLIKEFANEHGVKLKIGSNNKLIHRI